MFVSYCFKVIVPSELIRIMLASSSVALFDNATGVTALSFVYTKIFDGTFSKVCFSNPKLVPCTVIWSKSESVTETGVYLPVDENKNEEKFNIIVSNIDMFFYT